MEWEVEFHSAFEAEVLTFERDVRVALIAATKLLPKEALEHLRYAFEFLSLVRVRHAGLHSPAPARVVVPVCEGCALDDDGRQLCFEDGELCALTEGEFQLLRAFLAHPGQTMSRDALLDQIDLAAGHRLSLSSNCAACCVAWRK